MGHYLFPIGGLSGRTNREKMASILFHERTPRLHSIPRKGKKRKTMQNPKLSHSGFSMNEAANIYSCSFARSLSLFFLSLLHNALSLSSLTVHFSLSLTFMFEGNSTFLCPLYENHGAILGLKFIPRSGLVLGEAVRGRDQITLPSLPLSFSLTHTFTLSALLPVGKFMYTEIYTSYIYI